MTFLDFIFAVLTGLSVSFFTIWLIALMVAVLVACAIAGVYEKIVELINYWRFLYWLNQSHR